MDNAVALARFGCCPWDHAARVVRDLLKYGEARTPAGHRIRFVIFASGPGLTDQSQFRIISLGHVVSFLQEFLKSNWQVLRHAQFKDPAFGFLMTLQKAAFGLSPKQQEPAR